MERFIKLLESVQGLVEAGAMSDDVYMQILDSWGEAVDDGTGSISDIVSEKKDDEYDSFVEYARDNDGMADSIESLFGAIEDEDAEELLEKFSTIVNDNR